MYKLILVDDEEEVRKGISKKIEWEKYGFQIAGEAENGREALEIAEKTIPDVVITDIKMPFMDGLTLSEQLREKFPTTRVVILTGFDEFEYAQKAVKLNVVEYVLKPVSSQDVIDILTRIKSKLDEEFAQKEDIYALREHYRKSLPVLKEKFLASLVTGRVKKDEIQEKTDKYNINLNGKGFIVSAISLDNMRQGHNNDVNRQESSKSMFKLPEDRELLEFAVFNIVEEIIEKHSLGTAFSHNDQIVVISVSGQSERDEIINKTLSALEEIRQSVEKYLKHTITIGVGNPYNNIIHTNNSYHNAISALDYRLAIGNNRIILIEDVEPQSVKRIVFDAQKEHSLITAIKLGTAAELSKAVDDLFEEIINVKAAFKDYQVYILELITTIHKAARNSNIDLSGVFGPDYNPFVELYKYNDLQAIKAWIKELCTGVMKSITSSRQNACSQIVHKAMEYIKGNYHESDITVNKVCKYLHISPTYFSAVFKKEVKTTFINYLTQVRMEAAKELLRTSSMKSFEIAEKVGFAEPNYFSYCFKKNFGISPSEYRNSF